MRSNIAKIACILFFSLFFTANALAAVEVFSHYDTTLKINSNNTIEVNKSLTLKNVYDVGIVPGQIEFKIARGTEGSIGNIDILKAHAVDSFGNDIKTQVRETGDFSVIILDVYYPLLPGFEYDFNLFYELSYEPGGIFFKSLNIPLRESTIPIQKGEFKVILPENYHFTYVDSLGGTTNINGNEAVWPIKDDNPKSIIFEYSYLPLKLGGLQGSYVFWIAVNVLLLLFLIYEVRREIRRVKKEYER